MANVQVPGFHPLSRGGLTPELTRLRVLDNNTTAIFKGDALDAQTGGDVIVTATANAALYSVQWGGASYMSGGDRIERRYLPAATRYSETSIDAATASYVMGVKDMVNTEFKGSCEGALTRAEVNLNFKMVLGTGSTTSGWSAHEIDETTPATTATFPWRFIDFIYGNPKNDITAADCHMRLLANAGRREPALEIGGSLGT
jgi:hypothetical protein